MKEAVADNLETILRMLEIAAVVGGGAVVVFRTGKLTQRVESVGTVHAKELADVKTKIEKIGELVTDLAVQKSRLDSIDQRQNTLDRHIDELRHGDGYVVKPAQHAAT